MSEQASAAPNIISIDISRMARALTILRRSDYVLVLVSGTAAVTSATLTLGALARLELTEALLMAALCVLPALAAYTGWRHVGVIDPRVWPAYLTIFPPLAVQGIFMALTILLGWRAERVHPSDDIEGLTAVLMWIYLAVVAVPGCVCVLYLQRARMPGTGVRLRDLLIWLWRRGGSSGLTVDTKHRIAPRRGRAYGAIGSALLIGAIALPVPAGPYGRAMLQAASLLSAAGFFCLFRARCYLQIDAQSLLASDRRRPVLFLRSFADERQFTWREWQQFDRALLDFSLETRLANHFYRFGPFVAVGSPKDAVPRPGAARVILRDEEWQERVLEWMRDASLIVMCCGTTQWVNWELRQIIQSRRATSLLLMFPELPVTEEERKRDVLARTQQVREAFRDTPWNEELMTFEEYPKLRAMLFREDGSMAMIHSNVHSRDAYHLAALVAHQQLLDPDSAAVRAVAEEPARPLRWAVAALASLPMLVWASFWLLSSPADRKLTFVGGELYYADPVTEDEARKVGEQLVKDGLFSEDGRRTVRLERDDERYRLEFLIQPEHLDDPVVAIEWGALGSQVARTALGEEQPELVLSNPTFTRVRMVPPTGKLVFATKNTLYFTPPVTQEQANAVGRWLVTIGFFDEEQAPSRPRQPPCRRVVSSGSD